MFDGALLRALYSPMTLKELASAIHAPYEGRLVGDGDEIFGRQDRRSCPKPVAQHRRHRKRSTTRQLRIGVGSQSTWPRGGGDVSSHSARSHHLWRHSRLLSVFEDFESEGQGLARFIREARNPRKEQPVARCALRNLDNSRPASPTSRCS